MPRYTSKDKPDNGGRTIPNSPYLRPEQAKLRVSFNVRRSARLAKAGSSPSGKGVSSMKHARSPTPFPPVDAHCPRGGVQAGPTTVPRANASRLRPMVPSPPPNPVPGSSSNPINVDDDGDVEVTDASPPAPMVSDPSMPKSGVSTRRKARFHLPSGKIVDCDDPPTPRTTILDAIMEDVNEPSPPSRHPAPDSTRGPIGGSSLAAPKNKGKCKSLKSRRPFDFDAVSEAIESVARSAETPRERTERLAKERAEQRLRDFLRREEAREMREKEAEDAQVAHDERCLELEAQIRRESAGKILQLWKRFSDDIDSRERAIEQSKVAGASSSSIEECSKMVKKMDASIDSLLDKVKNSIDDAREQCTELQKSQPYIRNMCRELQWRHRDAAARIAQLQAEQNHMLTNLQFGLDTVPALFLSESRRRIRRYRELIDRERERLGLKSIQCAKKEVQAAFATYESKWAILRDVKSQLERPITFSDVPWPVFGQVKSADDLTAAAVKEFLLHLYRPLRGDSLRATLHFDLLCFYDNGFTTSVLDRVASSEDDREWNKIKEGGEEVLKILLTDPAFKF